MYAPSRFAPSMMQAAMDRSFFVTRGSSASKRNDRVEDGVLSTEASTPARRGSWIFSLLRNAAPWRSTCFPYSQSRASLVEFPFPAVSSTSDFRSDFARANEVLPSWLKEPKHRAVFLDRDGVINVDFGYVFETKDIAFVDGAVEFLRELKSLGYLLIVVTNQAGIARGIFTEADHHAFTAALMSRLRAAGVELQDVLYCPYHPEAAVERYRVDSLDRKPAPGLVLRAAERHSIDLFASWMIGDKESDRIALPYLRTLLLQGRYNLSESAAAFSSFDAILEKIRNG